jgi:hypothetical protein
MDEGKEDLGKLLKELESRLPLREIGFENY